MAYTPKTLAAWITENTNYDAFKGTAAGAPLIYQISAGTPTLAAADWFVWDYATEFPDTSQAPASADITTTGRTRRVSLNIVPDAPSASELPVPLGEDTDATLEAIEGFVAVYQGRAAGERLHIGNFLGVGKKTLVYAASVSWDAGINGTFPDPTDTTLSVTPNFGEYRELVVITNTAG